MSVKFKVKRFDLVGQITADFGVNCAFLLTSMKFGTEVEYHETNIFRRGATGNRSKVTRGGHFSKWLPESTPLIEIGNLII